MSLLSTVKRRELSAGVVALLLVTGAGVLSAASAQSKKKDGEPETFRAKAETTISGVAGANTLLEIVVDRYTPEPAIQTMRAALDKGGSRGFVDALKRSPIAGHLRVGEQAFTIRWARQVPTASGRIISLVVDSPVYFVGAGLPAAKPREGFDTAVIQLTMDSAGVGEGIMAMAAKIKAGGDTGVLIEDYASEPVKLRSVFKVIE